LLILLIMHFINNSLSMNNILNIHTPYLTIILAFTVLFVIILIIIISCICLMLLTDEYIINNDYYL